MVARVYMLSIICPRYRIIGNSIISVPEVGRVVSEKITQGTNTCCLLVLLSSTECRRCYAIWYTLQAIFVFPTVCSRFEI